LKTYPRLKTKEREAVLAHWGEVHKGYFAINDFITQFCASKGIALVRSEGDEIYTASLTRLLDEYYEVDQQKLDDARRDVLDKHVIDMENNRCTSGKSGSAPTPRDLPTTSDGKTSPGPIESSGATESKG
jgi:hypothetical protein